MKEPDAINDINRTVINYSVDFATSRDERNEKTNSSQLEFESARSHRNQEKEEANLQVNINHVEMLHEETDSPVMKKEQNIAHEESVVKDKQSVRNSMILTKSFQKTRVYEPVRQSREY